MPKLSDRIKYIRKLRDLSQAQLAEMAGTTQQAIQQAEKGRARQPRYLHQLAQALGVPANWMVVGEEIGAEKKARNEKLGLSEKGVGCFGAVFLYARR